MPELEYLTMTDLDNFEEELASSFNAEADANARVPPFPKGIYVMKVHFQEEEPDKRWVKKLKEDTQEVYYLCSIVAEIADNPANPPELVGRKVFGNAMTLVMKSTGTTSAQALIQAVGLGDKLLTMNKTHQTQVRLINEICSQGSLCGADTDWEASLYNKEKKVNEFSLKGMNSFPKDKAGNPIPMAITKDGQEVLPRNVIKRWLTLEQVVEMQNKALEEEDGDGDGNEGNQADDGNESQAPQPLAAAPPARTAPASAPAASARTAPPTRAAASSPAPPANKPPARRPVPTR